MRPASDIHPRRRALAACLVWLLLAVSATARAQLPAAPPETRPAGDAVRPAAADTLAAVRDTLAAPQDILAAAPDTLAAPPARPALLPDSPPSGANPAALTDPALADSLAARIGQLLQPAFRPDPQRALWLSLVLPGAGQFYNRKYWKLPVIYGGFLGCIYALSWNNQMLRDYSQAYLDIMDSDPATKSYEKMLPLGYDISGREDQFKEIFKNKKNYYRKYRDMSIFAFAAVYALAVIDAYVDAELSSFDISEDLSLELAPTLISTAPQAAAPRPLAADAGRGIGFALRLNF